MEWNGKLENGLGSVLAQLTELRTADGHWVGELSSSALSTATAITAIAFHLEATGEDDDELYEQVNSGLSWLVEQQNSDGGFGDTPLSHSNISTTMLTVASIHACKRVDRFSGNVDAAQRYVDSKGGIDGLKARYGNDKTFAVPILAHCAMAGIVPWKEVSALPFEAACVPQRFYNLLQLPVVSYAIPALVAIGQVKFRFDPPWDPLRRSIRNWSIEPSLKVLQRMQPASGGFLEAVPLTSFVAMALIKCGRHNHPVVKNGIRFLRESFRRCDGLHPAVTKGDKRVVGNTPGDQNAATGSQGAHGTWPIDTNLATWGTTLTVNAFANDPRLLQNQLESNPEAWQRCTKWILECQTKTRHPFTGAQPGGFGWTDLSGAVPDADDTPGALLALKALSENADHFNNPSDASKLRTEIRQAARPGVKWLLDLQNRDSGWPTFCKGWGKLPFDRSGSDITAHTIRGLLAWKDEFPNLNVQSSVDRGFQYLSKKQNADGSWLPLWFGNQDTEDEINPWYGTAKVLLAYRDANLFDTETARNGLEWLIESQNEDGGWGGGQSLNWAQLRRTFVANQPNESGSDALVGFDETRLQCLGTSSVEETALCTETLLHAMNCGSLESSVCQRVEANALAGVNWLINAIDLDCVAIHWPIGFYFAKLWYYEQMYPLVFTASALAAAGNVQWSPANEAITERFASSTNSGN